jgi:hypothetical protein
MGEKRRCAFVSDGKISGTCCHHRNALASLGCCTPHHRVQSGVASTSFDHVAAGRTSESDGNLNR